MIGKGQDEGWYGEADGGWGTAILYLVLFVTCWLAYKNRRKNNEKTNASIFCVLLFFEASVLFLNARMAVRLIMALAALLTISIPTILYDKNTRLINKPRQFIYNAIIIATGLFYHGFLLWSSWQNVVPYVPYWIN